MAINKHNSKVNRGFTIIETLVAVAILMISIAGPLAVANKSLTAALYAKDQSTASFLAQEGIEMIRNYKDNYVVKNVGNSSSGSALSDWVSSSDLSGCRQNTGACGIWYTDGSIVNPIVSPCINANGCVLYQQDTVSGYFGYVNDGTMTPPPNATIFTRSFYLNPVQGGTNEVQAVVTVTWKEGNVPNNMTLISMMTSKII